MRARVTSDTEPFPLRTLLVVWKLTPDRAATSFTETWRASLRTLTAALLWPSERSPIRRPFGPGADRGEPVQDGHVLETFGRQRRVGWGRPWGWNGYGRSRTSTPRARAPSGAR